MRVLSAAIAALALTAFGPTAGAQERIYANGQVWTGAGFEPRGLASRDGVFVDPASVATDAPVTDLNGRFIVPAYGNAHSHVTEPTEDASRAYLQAGVFYVLNPNTIPLGPEAQAFFDRPDTYDVAIAQGGVTEPGGHPEKLYVEDLTRWVPSYRGNTLQDYLGNAFHYGRTPAEIDAALDRLQSQGADVVKSYLLHSEEYERRRDAPEFYGRRGINPANAAYLVSAAGRRGLPVIFHVETRADLLVAARAGARAAVHLPGYGSAESADDLKSAVLTPEDAVEVARSGMAVAATYGLSPLLYARLESEGRLDPVIRSLHYAVQARNLRVLQQAGVPILTGTDGGAAIFDEIEHSVAIGGLTSAQGLAAVLSTGARLFPTRRIGYFDIGCEADFLTLDADPSADLRGLRAIGLIVKAGRNVVPAS